MSLVPYVKILDLVVPKGPKLQLEYLLGLMREGDVIFTECMEYDGAKHEAAVELHDCPSSSAVVLLQLTMVKFERLSRL